MYSKDKYGWSCTVGTRGWPLFASRVYPSKQLPYAEGQIVWWPLRLIVLRSAHGSPGWSLRLLLHVDTKVQRGWSPRLMRWTKGNHDPARARARRAG